MENSCRHSLLTIIVLVIIAGSSTISIAEMTPAEKLTTVFPDDIIFFFAASGGDSIKPSFEKTSLGKMWYAQSVQDFYKAIHNEIIKNTQLKSADVNEFYVVENFAKLVLSRPVAAGVAKNSDCNVTSPAWFFAIVDAGDKKTQIAQSLANLEKLAGTDEIVDVNVGSLKFRRCKYDSDAYWGWVENFLIFAGGDDKHLLLQNIQKPKTAPAGCLKNVPATNDAIIINYDIQKALAFLTEQTKQLSSPNDANIVKAVLNDLGIRNIKSATARIGFVGTDVIADAFLEVPAPRTGLLTGIEPIKIDEFDKINANAMQASIFKANIAYMYDTAMNACKNKSPKDKNDINTAIADFETKSNVSIRKGLIESIEGTTAFYTIPAGVMVQAPTGAFAIIIKLKDESLFEKNMIALGNYVAQNSEGMLQISTQPQPNGRTMHQWTCMPLAMMQIMPCWTVAHQHIVIATNPTLCNNALAQLTSPNASKTSIRTVEGFKKAAENLPDSLVSLTYTDSKTQMNQLMMQLQQYWPMMAMMTAQQGMNLPAVLPDLSQIINEIQPSCQYCWFDSTGLRTHYKGLGFDLGSIQAAPIALGILMPALSKVREHSQRIVSGSNLHQIGLALMMYANDHNDQYPPDIETMVKAGRLDPDVFISKRKPSTFTGSTYIYIAGQSPSMSAENILVYENPAYCTDGLNVLHTDGHVEFLERYEFITQLQKTYERLGRPMPKIEFGTFRESYPILPKETNQPLPAI